VVPYDPAVPTVSGSVDPRRSGGPLTVLERTALAVVCIAGVVTTVVVMVRGWTPVSDEALIEMAVRDVPRHLPLVGAYSRYGWSHPGPVQYLLLALPYRLMGSASAGLLVGAVWMHLAATLGAWLVARRLDATTGAAVLVAQLSLLAAESPAVSSSPWNPYVALSMTGLLVVSAWSTTERRPIGALLLLPTATLLVQSHLGTLPVVALVVASAGLVATIGSNRRRFPWRPFAIGAFVSAALWTLPLVQQLRDRPGNLTELWRWQTSGGGGARLGLSAALDHLTSMYGIGPSWLRATSADTAWMRPVLETPWLAIPVIAGLVVAFVRRDALMLRGLAVAAAANVGAVVGTATITGTLYSYLLVPTRGVAAVTLALAVGALLRASPVALRRVAPAALLCAAMLLATTLTVKIATGSPPRADHGAAVEALAAGVAAHRGDCSLFVTNEPGFDPSWDAQGLMLRLERRGIGVTTWPSQAARVGRHRVSNPDGRCEVRVAPPAARTDLESAGYEVVAEYQPFSTEVAARIDELNRRQTQAKSTLAVTTDPATKRRLFADVLYSVQEIDALSSGRVPMLAAIRRRPGG
jgi:hypothetical protein